MRDSGEHLICSEIIFVTIKQYVPCVLSPSLAQPWQLHMGSLLGGGYYGGIREQRCQVLHKLWSRLETNVWKLHYLIKQVAQCTQITQHSPSLSQTRYKSLEGKVREKSSSEHWCRSAPGLAEIEGEAIRRNIIPCKVAHAYYK